MKIDATNENDYAERKTLAYAKVLVVSLLAPLHSLYRGSDFLLCFPNLVENPQDVFALTAILLNNIALRNESNFRWPLDLLHFHRGFSPYPLFQASAKRGRKRARDGKPLVSL